MVILMRHLLLLLLALLLHGCEHDALDTAMPELLCDTMNVSFTGDILPIMQSRCAIPACHVAGGNGTGDFTIWSGVRTQVDNGKLIPAINRTVGAIPMPPDGSMIPACDIRMIEAWVNGRAQDN
jgi:hypothetical protein